MHYLAEPEASIQEQRVNYDSEDTCYEPLNASLTKGSFHVRDEAQETGAEMQDIIATEVISFSNSGNSSSETGSPENVSKEPPNKPMAEKTISTTTDDAHYVSRIEQPQNSPVNTCQSDSSGGCLKLRMETCTTMDSGEEPRRSRTYKMWAMQGYKVES